MHKETPRKRSGKMRENPVTMLRDNANAHTYKRNGVQRYKSAAAGVGVGVGAKKHGKVAEQ